MYAGWPSFRRLSSSSISSWGPAPWDRHPADLKQTRYFGNRGRDKSEGDRKALSRFCALFGKKALLRVKDRGKDCCNSHAVPPRQPSYGEEGGLLHGEPPSDVYDQQRVRRRKIACQALERGDGRLPLRDFHQEKQ